ncbi:MAG: ROK family protein [Bacteroidetes bacterium]|nr:ROK family protein [Bacteroidota bacterium]
MNVTTIGIDLGGTRIKAVALDGDGKIVHQQYYPTCDGDEDTVWKQAVANAVKEMQAFTGVQQAPVGISAPGLPDNSNACIACMPGRMQGLENFDWAAYLQQPAYVLNDAVAAMMGEATYGAAKNKLNVVMLTLGTGVGGAILIDGKPYQGAMRKAGHFGHMVINDEGYPDITGMPGSLEDCIGNCTVEKRTLGKFSSTQQMLDAYRSGDYFAYETWHRSLRQLAAGVASIANILSPEVIVIGGGIAEAGDDLFVPLEGYMKEYEWQPLGYTTPIVKAEYGDMAGAIGAACFALQKTQAE